MRRVLRSGSVAVDIMHRRDHAPADADRRVPLRDLPHARSFLRRHGRDAGSLHALRRMLAGEPSPGAGAIDDGAVFEQLARALVTGRLRIARHPRVEVLGRARVPVEDGPSAIGPRPVTWIEIELVDADETPVGGEPYELEDLEGQVHSGRLDGRGRARVEQVPAGICYVRFPTRDLRDWVPIEVPSADDDGEAVRVATTWIEIDLVDENDRPVGDEPYEIVTADGRVIDGMLDAKGHARIEGIAPGACSVSFPARGPDDWTPEDPVPALDDGVAPPAPALHATTWIEIELVDDAGDPVPGEVYEVTAPDGGVVSGQLDAHGCARVDGLAPGACRVTFPRRDAGEWEAA